ncbi:MAG: hypothetical protein RLZZ303_628 [Candidatus Hydrogenedentota bacterium]|jgi:predicted RNase H-like nuclease (RuvC/YqgF family)
MRNRRILYFVVLAVSVALAATYLERRQLQERHEAFLQSEREIEAAQSQIAELERALAEEQARAQDMANDPVEAERVVRRIKHAVRDGEKIFRVDAPTAESAAPPPPATAGATP